MKRNMSMVEFAKKFLDRELSSVDKELIKMFESGEKFTIILPKSYSKIDRNTYMNNSKIIQVSKNMIYEEKSENPIIIIDECDDSA